MKPLADKVALVTGASRGIGRAIALALADAGAHIALNYRSSEAEARAVADAVSERAAVRVASIRADVTSSDEVARLIDTCNREFDRIDILVNNAGIAVPRTIDELTLADWDETLRANLTSVFLVTQAVVSGMRARGWGRIINLSSVAARTGGIVGPHYTASKAGIIGLTHAYASRLAQDGITVNAIAPALIETEMLGEVAAAQARGIPVKRAGAADEVASVAVMLATNGFITGQTIGVDGGIYMT